MGISRLPAMAMRAFLSPPPRDLGALPVATRRLRTTGPQVHFMMFDRAMTDLTQAEIDYLAGQRLGRLATVGTDGRPHVVPVSFRYDADLGVVDIGGHHVATTKKFRDVRATGHAALVVDDLASVDPWRPRMVEIRGRAEAIEAGGEHLGPGFGPGFIRIHPAKVSSFGVDGPTG
jgi:pyridoxamine 5'-phosphate oxidase family protein